MILFTIATISPVLLILAAAMLGGIWAWLAVALLTILAFFLDRLSPEQIENSDPEAEFPASGSLLVLLGCSHLAVLPIGIWAVAGPGDLSMVDRGLIAAATSLFLGQISHPVAHELIHYRKRAMQVLGQLVYTSMLFGHHASAHLRVHHVKVASPADPNSAPLGEGFYNFALRAWPGGFMAGLRAENRLRAHRPVWQHPYLFYLAGGLASLLGATWLAGVPGLSALVMINLYAQLQILMSDYVQHYGLRRYALADGRLEPVGPQHSWNSPHWFTSAMTLNAPRHSDHHVAPSRSYPALQLDEIKMPCLPYSLPVMAGIALVPPLWRKIMDPRCHQWQPAWIEPREVAARHVSPAVIARAKTGGLPGPVLPELMDANNRSDPMPGHQRHDRPCRRADDGG